MNAAGLRRLMLGLMLAVSLGRAAEPAATGRFNVLDFGARADGVTLTTDALHRAIAAVKAVGGGTLYFPPGRYLTGSLALESNLTLYLEAGAELLYSGDPAHSPLVESRWEGTTAWTHGPLLYAKDKENITLTGRGTIDGQGANWWWRNTRDPARVDEARPAQAAWFALKEKIEAGHVPRREDFAIAAGYLRPSLVVFHGCRNLLIEGVTIRESPMWLLHPIYSENIVVRGVSFSSQGPNGDGIDVDSCRNVRISDCSFDTQDDCIVIKSGRDADGRRVGRPTEDVVITNCVMFRGHGGVVIGSEVSGGIARVTASNIVCKGTDRGIRIKTMRGRGAAIRDLRFSNWVIEDAGREAIQITAAYQPSPEEPRSERTPLVRGVAINAVTILNAQQAVEIRGLPEQAIEQVRLTDIQAHARKGLIAVEADGLALRDVQITATDGLALDIQRARGVTIDGQPQP